MATVTKLSICNMALTRVGSDKLTQAQLSADSIRAAQLVNAHYENCRDTLLRAHPWNWAVKRAVLVDTGEAPEFEFAYAFGLPEDFLKIIRTDSESEGINAEYRIENQNDVRVLITDEGSCEIEYIAQIDDTSLFDPLFVDILAQRLAAEICPALTDNANMTSTLWEVYQTKLREARGVDAQEGTPRGLDADTWTSSRV